MTQLATVAEAAKPDSKWIARKIFDDIEQNDLNEVLFTDPFTEETRKIKRNLLIASFLCLLIATLRLQSLEMGTCRGSPETNGESG
jgi:hypothetical protein